MATNLSSTSNKTSEDPSEDFMAEEAEGTDFDSDAEVVPPRVTQKDPSIRRKIEDRLERKRLRDELGIYDDDSWKDL
jgi:hypothetical protein